LVVRFIIRNYDLLDFFVLLQRVQIQSAHADFIIPRGGGRRERATITNVIVRICESLSTSPTPLHSPRGCRCGGTLPLTAMGYRGIVLCDSGSLGSHTLQTFLFGIGSLVFHYWSGAVDFSSCCALSIFDYR